jgi:hypothetical protein
MLDHPPAARPAAAGARARSLEPRRRSRRARQRRYRQRAAAGVWVIQIEVGAEVLDLLIRLRWLADADAGDKAAVGSAITRMLQDAARR